MYSINEMKSTHINKNSEYKKTQRKPLQTQQDFSTALNYKKNYKEQKSIYITFFITSTLKHIYALVNTVRTNDILYIFPLVNYSSVCDLRDRTPVEDLWDRGEALVVPGAASLPRPRGHPSAHIPKPLAIVSKKGQMAAE